MLLHWIVHAYKVALSYATKCMCVNINQLLIEATFSRTVESTHLQFVYFSTSRRAIRFLSGVLSLSL